MLMIVNNSEPRQDQDGSKILLEVRLSRAILRHTAPVTLPLERSAV